MKKSVIKLFGLLAAVSLLAGSCSTNVYENPNPNPTTPTGYQHIFNDDFNSDRYGWSFNDNYNSAYGRVANGEYELSYQAGNDLTYSSTIPTNMNTNYDWDIETRVESNNAIALNFGVGNNEFGYTFFLDRDGYYAVYDEGTPNVQPTKLLDWQFASNTAEGYNTLAIEQIGNRWYGYINNQQVFNLPAQKLYGNSVGFLIMSNTIGYADYLTVKW